MRKKQYKTACSTDSGYIWERIYNMAPHNSCGCDANKYHYEYEDGTIFAVCNNCGVDLFTARPKNMLGVLAEGMWLDDMERAKSLIREFLWAEYQKDVDAQDFADLTDIGLAYTTVGDEELPIQASADLINYCIKRELWDITIETRKYDTLYALIQNELESLNFDDLTWASDENIRMVLEIQDPDSVAM